MDFTKTISFSLLFLSLLTPTTVTAACTNAVCRHGDPIIRFPFRLNPHQLKSCGYDKGFDLTCGSDGVNRTTITLPFSGDFTVEMIDYAAQEIWINDPHNCLPKRILTLNLSATPFAGVYARRFTFFNCPTSEYLRFRPLNPITCLSNKNSTVFATASPRVVNYLLSQSCREMKTVEVPVRWPFYEQAVSYSELSDNLWLTWRVPRCGRCEIRGGKCGIKSNSSRETICSDAHKPEIGKARSNLGLRFTSFCPIMAVAENAGVKVDSSAAQNLDKNNNTVEANSENR